MNTRNQQTVGESRKALEHLRGIALPHTGAFTLDETVAATKHCEQMIGITQIPLGIAGPLCIQGQEHDIYVPMATTEGALIASVNRGCKVITTVGGAATLVKEIGMSRGPVFRTEGIGHGQKIEQWLVEHFSEIQTFAQNTSHHLQLHAYETKIVGRQLFVRFNFHTGDAMGMNMVTIATAAIVALMEKTLDISCVALAANFDSDKKPSAYAALSGRGKQAWAEVTIPTAIVQTILKTTPALFHDVAQTKNFMGSALSGSMGHNAHIANILAAVFIATGQDPAHVVEGSLGMTTTDVLPTGDLYISVYLPALLIGTVGGGTGLATQKEALEILGVQQSHNTELFAQSIVAACLAGEISLLAALAQRTLASSHERLARGK